MNALPTHYLELQSLITFDGEIELSLNVTDIPEPGPEQVVIRVEAAPINPSDILLLLGPVDPTTLVTFGSTDLPVTRGRIARGHADGGGPNRSTTKQHGSREPPASCATQ